MARLIQIYLSKHTIMYHVQCYLRKTVLQVVFFSFIHKQRWMICSIKISTYQHNGCFTLASMKEYFAGKMLSAMCCKQSLYLSKSNIYPNENRRIFHCHPSLSSFKYIAEEWKTKYRHCFCQPLF